MSLSGWATASVTGTPRIQRRVIQTIGGDRMVGPLGVIVSPFRPTSRKKGGDRTTTLRRRDVSQKSHVEVAMRYRIGSQIKVS